MPMYFPDLESVRKVAEIMAKHQEPENLYKGIIPTTEEELPQARKELANYFRTVWKDEIQALEVELGATEENYYEKIGEAIKGKFIGR